MHSIARQQLSLYETQQRVQRADSNYRIAAQRYMSERTPLEDWRAIAFQSISFSARPVIDGDNSCSKKKLVAGIKLIRPGNLRLFGCRSADYYDIWHT